MCKNGYLWTSGVNLDTTFRFPDPDFLIKCKILVICRRFPLIFAFYMLKVRHIFTSGLFDLLTQKAYHTRRPPTAKISAKFEVDMTIHCWVIAFLRTICYVTLWPGPLTLNSCHTWQVIWPTLPPSLKTLRLSVLELWVMTFSAVYRWKWTCGHCTCAESRDPCVGGQKQLHFWNPRPQFASSLYHFYGARTTIKGHLLLSRPTLNSFSAEKDKSKIGPKIGSFLGKLG